MLVALAGMPLDNETAVTVDEIIWPTLPAAAAAPVVSPTIFGVAIVGDVPSTMLPDPVTAEPRAVPTPVPSPVRDETATPAHANAVDGPVETMACPEAHPTGFSN